ncbi:MmyB family transcriptional regulator [Trebonia kvetii]|uniref:MmyB family transcriptional regulator n=1 Tax=Trebonia kvetii TaxID=2480626 RepID=UPI00119E8BE0|nr:hypothetical protein [Trebonia kvetii]
MDREPLAQFRRASPEETATPGESGDHAGRFMTHLVERLSDHPAVVFSRFGEVLSQTPPAIALFGDYTRFGRSSRSLVDRWFPDLAVREHYLVRVGVTDHDHLRRYWHPELGGLELYRQLLLDPVEYQVLLVFMAVPGSPSEEKLRLLAAAGD